MTIGSHPVAHQSSGKKRVEKKVRYVQIPHQPDPSSTADPSRARAHAHTHTYTHHMQMRRESFNCGAEKPTGDLPPVSDPQE